MEERFEVTYKEELKKELRKKENYFDQLVNLLKSTMFLLESWIYISVLYTVFIVITIVLFVDPTEYNNDQLLYAFRQVAYLSMILSAFVCIVLRRGKFSNVFRLRAIKTVEMYNETDKDIKLQISITESVLAKHGLIKKDT